MTSIVTGDTLPIRNGRAPPEGARSYKVVFRILAAEPARCDIDLARAGMSFVQTVFIDNSANTNPMTLEIGGTGQTVSCLARTQGFFAVLCPTTILSVTCATAGTVDIPCQFLNVALPPITYSAQPTAVAVSGVVPITGNVTANQAGAWNVGQSGAWSVSATQSGAWNVGQSGAWSVSATQSGAWNVGQSGSWTVRSIGGSLAAYGIAAPAQLATGAGRLRAVSVIVPGAAGAVYDAVGAAVNPIATIPAIAGSIQAFDGGWPCSTGIYVVPGAGQVLAVAWEV